MQKPLRGGDDANREDGEVKGELGFRSWRSTVQNAYVVCFLALTFVLYTAFHFTASWLFQSGSLIQPEAQNVHEMSQDSLRPWQCRC